MPRNHFQLILEFVHFNDNSRYNANDPNCDCIYKVRPAIEYLTNKFKSVYTLDKEISIDEELLLWKEDYDLNSIFPTKDLVLA